MNAWTHTAGQFPAFSWVLELWLGVCRVSVSLSFHAINRSTQQQQQTSPQCVALRQRYRAPVISKNAALKCEYYVIVLTLTVYPADSWAPRGCVYILP